MLLFVMLVAPLLFPNTAALLLNSHLSPSPLTLPAVVSTRRSFFKPLKTAAAAVVAVSLPIDASNAATTPSVLEGMSAFAAGNVERSIEIYDSIVADNPRRKPYLWQRGLSLYYAGRFEDGADQFAADVAVNPNDTEEQIWHLLCLAQLKEIGSLEAARSMALTVGEDRRPVMRAVQSLFLSSGPNNERALIDLANKGDVGSRFYASLYLSLYYESMKDASQSEKWMIQAVGTDYAQITGARDPMVELAKVAVRRRGWSNCKAAVV